MISPADTMATSLWRTHIEHGAFVPRIAPKAQVTRSGLIAQGSLLCDDNGDTSELPYLSEDKAESGPAFPPTSSTGESSRPRFDRSFLATMFFDDSDSDDESTAGGSVESFCSQSSAFSLIPKLVHSSSRPVLGIRIDSTTANVEPSSPSPVDSGYGSRPNTPFIEKDNRARASRTKSSSSDVDSIASTENIFSDDRASLSDAISDLEFFRCASPAKNVIFQGPQIILFDEHGRVVDATFDDHHAGSFSSAVFDTEDVDGPYGGMVPAVDDQRLAPAANVGMKNLVGATPYCGFAAATELRAQDIHFPTTPIYRNCLPALAFVLDCVEEEEEEEMVVEEDVEEDTELDGFEIPFAPRPKPVSNEEDDECEECGLFFTVPDANYFRLSTDCFTPVGEPQIAFGILKTLVAVAPVKQLNTAYHAAAEGRTSQSHVAECVFDCENGYWMKEGGLAMVNAPRDCPAHGGHGACHVGAVFHHTSDPVPCSTPSLDYAAHAAEIVGVFVLPSPSSYDDLDEDGLVLHSAELLRAPEQRHVVPKTGANYDEFMSGFMDDVDLGAASSNDRFKAAPLGKFGDTLKELRDAAMPEAVDHLKEGLGKTESVFRAALAASPFRFGDKLIPHLRHKSSSSREKLTTNEFYNSMKERSAVSMKGKWSNMLNKFGR